MPTLPIETRIRIIEAVEAVTAWQCREITARVLFRRLIKAIGSVQTHAVRALLSRHQSTTEVEGLIRRALSLPRDHWEAPTKEGGS